MTPVGVLQFAADFRPNLPDTWGFLVWVDDDGVSNLIVSKTEPPMPPGWMIWLAKKIAGGRTLKGGVLFSEDDTPQDVEARAWVVLGVLRGQETRDAAKWN